MYGQILIKFLSAPKNSSIAFTAPGNLRAEFKYSSKTINPFFFTLSNQVSNEILVLEYKSQSICKRDIFEILSFSC